LPAARKKEDGCAADSGDERPRERAQKVRKDQAELRARAIGAREHGGREIAGERKRGRDEAEGEKRGRCCLWFFPFREGNSTLMKDEGGDVDFFQFQMPGMSSPLFSVAGNEVKHRHLSSFFFEGCISHLLLSKS